MIDHKSDSVRPAEDDQKPLVAKISRREFAKAAGAVVAAGSAAILVGKWSSGDRPSGNSRGHGRVVLPPHPSHSPAFLGHELEDGSVVLYTHREEQFIGYKLNHTGCQIWRLCDGKTTRDSVAGMYAEETGRRKGEALEFLQRLHDLQIVVSGGYVNPAGDLPRPGPGDCYHVRTSGQGLT